MITAERIRELAVSREVELIRHVKNNTVYQICYLMKVKIDGEWREVVMYSTTKGPFGRLLNDFDGFVEM